MNQETITPKHESASGKLAEALKSIGHPERIDILRLISRSGQGKMTVKSIYSTLHLPQPIVSRHLGIMRRNGLVDREQHGNDTYYSLHPGHFIIDCLTNFFSKEN